MVKAFYFIVCSCFCLTTQAQQVNLLKSTLSNGGGAYSLLQSGLMLNQTIGQSSLTSHFNSGPVHLLQGFQHPYRQGFALNMLATETLLVYPNPTIGKINIKWAQPEVANVEEKLIISLFTMAGKLIVEDFRLHNGNPVATDYSLVPKGVYLLKVVGKRSGQGSTIIILN